MAPCCVAAFDVRVMLLRGNAEKKSRDFAAKENALENMHLLEGIERRIYSQSIIQALGESIAEGDGEAVEGAESELKPSSLI